MSRQNFAVAARSAAPPDQVFAVLADAPRWPEWAGRSISHAEWVRTGSPSPGGTGAVRRLGGWPLFTEETITAYDPPSLMSYDVRGLPVRDYSCTVELAPDGRGGTAIRWTGEFRAPRLLAAPLRAMLRGVVRGFADALAEVAASPPVRG
jgi:uncharacterized protein YndB with AHSA1/START domain